MLSLSLSLPNIAIRNRGGGAWSPLDLGDDLLAWWDAGTGTTLSGSAVTAWADKKHGHTVTQGLSAARPIYSATSFGGAPGLAFDGTDDRLVASGIFGFPSGASASTVHVVVQQNAAPADTSPRTVFAYGNTAATERRVRRVVQVGANRVGLLTGDGSSGVITNGASVDFSSRHLIEARFGSTQSEVSLDSAPPTSAAIVPATATDMSCIGASSSGAAQYWHGIVRDVLVTLPLSAEKASALQTFLLARRAL